MASSGNDSEQLNFGKQERQPHASRIYLLTQQAEKLRENHDYCEWEDGKVVSKYLDINWRRVELDMPTSFNRQRRLSFAQLDALSKMTGADLAYFYADVISPEHFALIDKYRQACYPESVAPVAETEARPSLEAGAETARELSVPGSDLADEAIEAAEEPELIQGAEVKAIAIGEGEGAEIEEAGVDPQASVSELAEKDSRDEPAAPPSGAAEAGAPAEKLESEPAAEEFLPALDLPEVSELLEIFDIPLGDEFPPASPADNAEPVPDAAASLTIEKFMPSVVIVGQPQLAPAEKKRLWATAKAIIRDNVEALSRRISHWKEKHPDKLWAGGLAGGFLLAVGLFASFNSESQPAAREAQPPAAVAVIDDAESFIEFSRPPAETAPFDSSPRTSDAGRPAGGSLPAAAASPSVSKPFGLASDSESAPREITPTTAEAQPRPTVEAAEESPEPEDVQLTSAAPAETEKESIPVLRHSTASLNSDMVEKQLAENSNTNSSRQSTRAEDGYSVTGEQAGWLRSAGIAESDWGFADFIVTRESSWKWWVWSRIDPNSYGLPQRNFDVWPLKRGETFMNDPVAQLEWAADYAERRYGGGEKAADFHRRNKWW